MKGATIILIYYCGGLPMSHKLIAEKIPFSLLCLYSHLNYGELNTQPVPYIAVTMTLHLWLINQNHYDLRNSWLIQSLFKASFRVVSRSQCYRPLSYRHTSERILQHNRECWFSYDSLLFGKGWCFLNKSPIQCFLLRDCDPARKYWATHCLGVNLSKDLQEYLYY